MVRTVEPAGWRALMTLTLAAWVCGLALVASASAEGLPDGRAYELVSPPGKNGGDVLIDTERTRAASDGTAVSFSSLSAFGDALGTGIATDYVAVRASSPQPGRQGWSTHAITPPQQSLTFLAASRGLEPLYEGAFSPDLSRGVFRAWSPLADSPNVDKVENLYVRTDLTAPGAGSYQLLTDAVAPVGFANPLLNAFQPRFAGASSDFEHVIFESRYHLTADAPPGIGPKLFEWDHGTVRLVGVLPDGSAAPSSVAGAGAFARTYTPHTISADGRRIFFTDPTTGNLYMRQTDGVTQAQSTVQLNASERTDCAGDPTCGGDNVPDPSPDPSGAQPATYWNASVDGSRVFFTTPEALTDDAPLTSDNKLYMYDTSKPDSDPHNLTLVSVDAQPDDGADVTGVIGVSADGHYVYFIAGGQLVAGLPSPSSLGPLYGLYVWHDGAVAYIGGIYVGNVALNASQDFQDDPAEARVTPDGKYLLFMSTNGVGLTGYDHNQGACSDPSGSGCRELYIYSAVNQHLSCASCNPSGARATADASTQVRVDTGGSSTTPAVNRAISDDGRRVFFTTGEALVPQDTNGKLDAYEYDVPTGTAHLLSTGKDTSDSYFMTASASGDDAFILTRQRLVGWDTDGAYDLYDVRVGGGFPAPSPSAPCIGDACHGTSTGTPDATTPGSTLVKRPSTHGRTAKLKPKPVHCKRGFVRKRVRGKVRCVKRPRRVAKRANVGRKAR